MKIFINNETKEVNFTTLGEWINAELGSDGKGFAVAVNDSVIPTAKWNTYALQEGDRILVVQATQGG